MQRKGTGRSIIGLARCVLCAQKTRKEDVDFSLEVKESTTAHMAQEDPKGERGGDTGETKQVGHGQHAEKGDARREKMGNEGKGPTHSSDDARAQGEKTRTAGG